MNVHAVAAIANLLFVAYAHTMFNKSNCTRTVTYVCPCYECTVGLCKDCLHLQEARADRTPVYVEERTEVLDANHDVATVVGEDDESSSLVSDHEHERGEHLADNEEEEKELVDYIDYLFTGGEEELHDLDMSNERDELKLDEVEPILPRTIAGRRPAYFRTLDGHVPGHVILNQCGSLLVRTRSQLRGTIFQRNFLQSIAARSCTNTVPLAYPEAMLFPSIFWKDGDRNGGFLGAIPAPVLGQKTTSVRNNIASMADHARVRLKTASSTSSTSYQYLCYMFDCLANTTLVGHDSRIILNRGFSSSRGSTGLRVKNEADDFYTDSIDNRQVVHNLCASEKDLPMTLFLTLSCNQRDHFGVRNIKRWLDSGLAEQSFPGFDTMNALLQDDIKKCLCEAGKTLLLRNWLEVRQILLNYIVKSPEKPLGTIEKFFARDEYQEKNGNLPHMHALFALRERYDTEEGRSYIHNLVRGFIGDLVREDEIPVLIEERILESVEDWAEMRLDGAMMLKHSHTQRCLRKTGPKPEDVACRVPNNFMLNPSPGSFSMIDLNPARTEMSLEILVRLGLVQLDRSKPNGYKATVEALDAKRLIPPAVAGEGIISPVNGRLFAACRSSQNLQVCTTYSTSRYVAKYVAKMDENNRIVLHVDGKDPELYRLDDIFLHNTKITSSAINEKLAAASERSKNHPTGRAMSSMEMMQLILGNPQVYHSMEYKQVSTMALGQRPGIEQKGNMKLADEDRLTDLASDQIELVALRRSIIVGDENKWRQHTAHEELILLDQQFSNVTVDAITVFGVRPPELRELICEVAIYYRFFIRETTKRKEPIWRNT